MAANRTHPLPLLDANSSNPLEASIARLRAEADDPIYEGLDKAHAHDPLGLPEWQACRDCGSDFPYSDEADRCPTCVSEGMGS